MPRPNCAGKMSSATLFTATIGRMVSKWEKTMNFAKLRRVSLALVVAGAVGLFGHTASVRAADPIVLKGLIPWPADFVGSHGFLTFQKEVNKALKGKVIVSLIGGSEVVPPFEQFEAVRDGVVDVLMTAGAYYRATVPEAAASLGVKKFASELRKLGYTEVMRKIHAEHGVYYHSHVGGTKGNGYRCYGNKKIAKADLTGMKMRVSPTYVPLVKGLNGTPILMKAGEVYTAMERGVVDGFCWTFLGIRDFGFHEVTKFVYDIPFYSNDTAVLINMKKWNSLPADIRKAIDDLAPAIEIAEQKFMTDMNNKEDAALKKEGLEFISLNEAETKKWLAAAYDAHWVEIDKKSPKYAPELRKFAD